MAIAQFLKQHAVFTVDEFESAFPGSQTDRNLLSRAVRAKRVDRVRRGLYVSRSGRFEGAPVDPLLVARAAVEDCTFSYLSALQIHGVLHNVVFQVQFYTGRRISAFEYGNITYVPIRTDLNEIAARSRSLANGTQVRVTTREQTILDCLDRTSRAGGTENALRSISAFEFADVDTLINLAIRRPIASVARTGWLLETLAEPWRVTQAQLDKLRKQIGDYTTNLDANSGPGQGRWVNQWRLYLPAAKEEVNTWFTQL